MDTASFRLVGDVSCLLQPSWKRTRNSGFPSHIASTPPGKILWLRDPCERPGIWFDFSEVESDETTTRPNENAERCLHSRSSSSRDLHGRPGTESLSLHSGARCRDIHCRSNSPACMKEFNASRICWGYIAFVLSMVGRASSREFQSSCLRTCRFESNSYPEAQRVVIQHIEGNTHMWEEHEMGDGCMCIVQILPEEGHLNEGDAARLLQVSANWTMDTNMIKLREMEASLLGSRAFDPVNTELPQKDLDREMTVFTNKSETFLVSKMDTVGVPVKITTEYPWYNAGRLYIQYGEFYALCSFILLSPYMALTNAHCIFDDDGESPQGVFGVPAQYLKGRRLEQPYGMMSACSVVPMSLYDPLDNSPNSFGYDYGGIIFPRSETPGDLDKMTFMPLQFDLRIRTGDILNMAAYSSDQMFHYTGGVSSFTFDGSINSNGRILYHAMPCEKGTSGGPIWVDYSSSPRLIALNAGLVGLSIEDSEGGYILSRNVGARFVPEDKDTILRWLDMANRQEMC